MTDTISVQIPFGGFYESLWSGAIDREEESFIENEEGAQRDETYSPDRYQPEHLRLSGGEIADILCRVTQYSEAHSAVARMYVDEFDVWAAENIGTPIHSFKLEAMTSPREYNFETDRLFCDVPLATMQTLFERSAAQGHAKLAEFIDERFTSHDGFSSFYSSDSADWLAKPLTDWDHNEAGTLLLLFVKEVDTGDDMDMAIYDAIDDGLYQAWSESVAWPAYELAVAELRDEKAQDWALEHPTEEPPYRCPLTLKLAF